MPPIDEGAGASTGGAISVGVLFGGRSAEHDVSCASALSVLRALAGTGSNPVATGITREGRFVLVDPTRVEEALRSRPGPGATAIDDALVAEGLPVVLVPGRTWGTARIAAEGTGRILADLDVVFPVLHGPFGEDGTIQGMLDVLGVPYVGSGVLGSAVAMDKVATKRAFVAEGLPVAPWRWFPERRWGNEVDADALVAELGLPLFVKPANMGSSVGVSKAGDRMGLEAAVAEALRYDDVVLVESLVEGREIECGILGGHDPEASLPGEIVVSGDGFYDYEAKYLSPDSARTVVPAEISAASVTAIRRLSLRAFEAVHAWGLARVDVFHAPSTGRTWVNEVNTLPGFTSISMYAQMWAATGVSYEDLVVRLLDLALERHERMLRRATLPGTR